MSEKAEKYRIKSLDHALMLIDLLNQAGSEMGITEISNKMGLGRSTVHRILTTLQSRNYITQNPRTEKYRLGFQFVKLSNDILQRFDTITLTRDVIEIMVEDCGVTALLFTYSNGQVNVIERYPCKNERLVHYYIGIATNAHYMAAGKAIMSTWEPKRMERYLEKASFDHITPFTITSVEALMADIEAGRSRGWFSNYQESDEGLVEFAVPFSGIEDMPFAISLCGPASKMQTHEQQLTQRLIDSGKQCSELCSKSLNRL